MTLEDILYTVVGLSERLGGPSSLSIESYNRYLKLVNLDLLRDLYGNPKDIAGYETKQYYTDALAPFKSLPSELTIASGSGSLPDDYLHAIGVYYIDTPYTREVDLVTTAQSIERRSNSVTGPSAKYPIAELFNGKIDIYPTSITSVYLVDLKKPTPETEPFYALKTENGIDVYDPDNSVEFLWPIDMYTELIRRILLYLGVATTNEFIVSYLETKKQQEI